MRKIALALSLSSAAFLLQAADTPAERLSDAAKVFSEIMATPDKGIPQDLLEKANCAVIVPGMKQAGFIVGAKYGKGFAVCRKGGAGGGWGAVEAIRVEGGSFGFQIGASNTDVVMLVMNEKGMRRLTEDKFTLGAEATVAAGPVGRQSTAQTDAQLSAEILSWSRSKGLFAGIALTGATLRPDNDVNQELYGSKLSAKEILTGSTQAPAAAETLVSTLTQYSRHESADRPAESRAKDAVEGTADRKKKK
jgi:lipid-binding SYLF domain-containing protein